MNPKSLANLKPCKKGETHNPNGRPKGVKPWATVLKELFESGEFDQSDVVRVHITKAFKGEPKAMDFIADRMDGKAKNSLEISSINLTDEQKDKIKRLFDETGK